MIDSADVQFRSLHPLSWRFYYMGIALPAIGVSIVLAATPESFGGD